VPPCTAPLTPRPPLLTPLRIVLGFAWWYLTCSVLRQRAEMGRGLESTDPVQARYKCHFPCEEQTRPSPLMDQPYTSHRPIPPPSSLAVSLFPRCHPSSLAVYLSPRRHPHPLRSQVRTMQQTTTAVTVAFAVATVFAPMHFSSQRFQSLR
jgi:hypothetical protein